MSSHSSEKLRTAFTQFTLVIVLVFGGMTTITLLEAPSKMLEPDFVAANSPNGSRFLASRSPASVTSGNAGGALAIVEASCTKPVTIQTSSERVRLKIKDCPLTSEKDLASSSLKNQTNGQDASLFLQPDGLTTEYLSLAVGMNQFVLKYEDKDKKTQEVILPIEKL